MMVYVLLLNSAVHSVGVSEINLGHDVKGRHHGKGSTGFIGTESQVAAG
jgi:hypothetical protein